jgi:hypothetical protein
MVGIFMKMKTIGIAIAIPLVLALVFLVVIPYRTVGVSKYIEDGGEYTLEISGYGSRLYVSLTSSHDYMSVRIVVDGRVVYDNSRTYNVKFEYGLGFGYHVIHVIIGNPTTFGLGPTIFVSGSISYNPF